MRFAYVVVAACLGACGSVETSHDAAVGGEPAPVLPQVTSVTPARGIVTTQVTLTGTGFGDTKGSVTVEGTGALVGGWTDTSITITIPDVLPADADVVVTAAAGAGPAAKFKVILPPTIYLENDTAGADTFDSITALSFDETTGMATQIGDPVTIGGTPSSYGGCSKSLWVNMATRRLFATANDKLAIYNIDPVTGALTKVSGSPFASGGTRDFAVMSNAAGTRVFVNLFGSGAAGTNKIGVFDLAGDGHPTAVAGSPFTPSAPGDTFTLSKDETYLYTNYWGGGMFGGNTIAANGALTALTGTNPSGANIMRRPGTDQLYVSDSSVAVWNAAADGSVTQITGSPFTNGAGSTMQSGAFTPDGSRAYFAPYESNTVVGFDLAADGTPTPLAGSPFTFTPALAGVSCIAISQDGAHLIVADETGHKVGVFTLDATGTPAQVPGSPFAYVPTSSNASGLAITF